MQKIIKKKQFFPIDNIERMSDNINMNMHSFLEGGEGTMDNPMQKFKNMLALLNEDDGYIIRQLASILFRYLEKRGRV